MLDRKEAKNTLTQKYVHVYGATYLTLGSSMTTTTREEYVFVELALASTRRVKCQTRRPSTLRCASITIQLPREITPV